MELTIPEKALFTEIAALIEQTRRTVYERANAATTMLFWDVCKRINDDILNNKRADYGKQIVSALAAQLTERYGRSFEARNLRRMMQFAEQFADSEIVVPLARQLTWSHILILLPLQNMDAKLYYAKMATENLLGKRALRKLVERKAYERREIANTQLSPKSRVPQDTFKDPYLFDVLGLKDAYLESDLEAAIYRDLENFIMEFGKGFTFVERQKRMIIDGENEPIGVILCAEGNREQIELLDMDKDGIMVAEYWTTLPSKADFEANNWILRNVAETYPSEPIHIITSSIEHHSVINACKALEKKGIEITFLPVNNKGNIIVSDIEAAVKSNTRLVSIMLANNEIGTIQPIPEIGRFLKGKGILFHTDAVQAVGHISVEVSDLNVDFLTASAHKFNGAKGVGILYVHSDLGMSPMIFGGEQEHGIRAGTENVAGIVAAGYAIEESVGKMANEATRLRNMVNATVSDIKEKIPTVRVNGDSDCRLPGTLNLGFDGVSGEAIMHLLDMKGICVSTSSACTSGKDEPSHVLLALGQTEQQARSAIRISYGKNNSGRDVVEIVNAVCSAYTKIITASRGGENDA